MAANATTKIQINYGKDGVLVNVYADNQGELETLLASVQDLSSLINSVNGSLRGTPAPTVASVAAAFNATPVAAGSTAGGAQEVRDRYGNLWIYNLPEAPECARGAMVLKHGTAKESGKPYKGWFDPAAGPNWAGPKVPKEQQYQTIWA